MVHPEPVDMVPAEMAAALVAFWPLREEFTDYSQVEYLSPRAILDDLQVIVMTHGMRAIRGAVVELANGYMVSDPDWQAWCESRVAELLTVRTDGNRR